MSIKSASWTGLRSLLEFVSAISAPKSVLMIGTDDTVCRELETIVQPIEVQVLPQRLDPQLTKPEQGTQAEIILSGSGGEKNYYFSSLDLASGLIEPESLSFIWQNVTTVSSTTISTVRLADYINETQIADWLWIESLAALDILESLSDAKALPDLIAFKAPTDWLGTPNQGASLDRDPHGDLLALGYQAVGTWLGRNPKVSHIIFIRDWKLLRTRDVAALQQVYDADTKKLQKELAVAHERIEELSKTISEREDAFERERRSLTQELNSASTANAKLQSDLELRDDAHAAELDKLLDQIESLTAEAEQVPNLRAQFVELTKTHEAVQSSLAAEKERAILLAKELKTASETQQNSVTEHQAELERSREETRLKSGELDVLIAKLSEAEGRSDQLKRDLDERSSLVESLEAEQADSEKELLMTKNNLASTRRNLRRLNKEIIDYRSSVIDLETALHSILVARGENG